MGETRGPLARPVLSLLALAAFAALIALGVWQVQRLAWKEALLADVAAARIAPPQNITAVLRRAERGEDIAFTRVAGRCPRPAAPARLLYDLQGGEIVWRVLGDCDLGGVWRELPLDRGVLERASGAVAPPRGYLVPEQDGFTAVVRRVDDRPVHLPDGRTTRLSDVSSSAYMLSVEAEDRPVPGIRPAPLPAEIRNNHLGYAITWFGMALALAGVYLAMLLAPREAA